VKTFDNQRNATQASDLDNSRPGFAGWTGCAIRGGWNHLVFQRGKPPGVDGEIKLTVQARLPAILKQIRNDILSDAFGSLPARRVCIPKANGKQRPLGILTLRDRIVQWAKLMAGMRPLKLRGNIKLPSK
jgi:hypothetical protein